MSEERRQRLFELLKEEGITPHPATGIKKLEEILKTEGILVPEQEEERNDKPAKKDRSNMVLHCGGIHVTREQVEGIPIPAATKTYSPIHHLDIVDIMIPTALDLTGMTLRKEMFGVARKGSQFFFLLSFENGNEEMGFSVAGRNSYDKSIKVGIGIGASVFVCDNLALSGDITIMRKHTGNALEDLKDQAVTTLYRNKGNFDRIVEDATKMKKIAVSDDEAFAFLGMLYGRDLLLPRQFTQCLDEWKAPQHEEFKPKNMWSLYNCVTETLKSTPPGKVMENHRMLHDIVSEELPSNPIIIDMAPNRAGEFSLA